MDKNMSKNRFSSKEICDKYPKMYIAVHVIEKDYINNLISCAEVLKVYQSLEDCKKNIKEIKYFMDLYKEEFDIIFGDYKDYQETRLVINAFAAFGCIAFEMFNPNHVDDLCKLIESIKEK